MTTGLDIRAMDPDHCLAVWKKTILAVWRGAPKIGAVNRMMEVCKAVLDAERGVTMLAIIERTSPAPEGEARKALAKWSGELCSRMSAAVVVTEGGGFRGAMIRGVGIAFTTLMPHKVPFKFVGRQEEGLDLLAPHLPLTSNAPAELAQALAELRREFDLRHASR